MQLIITREAVCAQDDQIGPLEMTLEFDAFLPIFDLINAVHNAKFLQFSSTHTTMLGVSSKVEIVKVHDKNLAKTPDEYIVSACSLCHEIIKNRHIHFTFIDKKTRY